MDLDFFILRVLSSILVRVYPLGISNGLEASASEHLCCWCWCLLEDAEWLLFLLSQPDEDEEEE